MDSRQQFEEWFDMMQDVGEHCGTSLGQWHRDLMEAAWDASRESLVVELPASYRSAGSKFELLNKQHMIDVLTENGIRTK